VACARGNSISFNIKEDALAVKEALETYGAIQKAIDVLQYWPKGQIALS